MRLWTASPVAAKSRLAKKSLTVPRLDLVSAHMFINLVINAFVELPKPDIYAWLYSTVALHWLLGNGEYKQFVANRFGKIKKHGEIQWRYVPTKENPVDVASRGSATVSESWWSGSEWLPDHERWPENPVIEKSETSKVEAKAVKEILTVAHANETGDSTDNIFEELLKRHDLQRNMRLITRDTKHIVRTILNGFCQLIGSMSRINTVNGIAARFPIEANAVLS